MGGFWGVLAIKSTSAILWLGLSLLLATKLEAAELGAALLTLALMNFASALASGGLVQILLKSATVPVRKLRRSFVPLAVLQITVVLAVVWMVRGWLGLLAVTWVEFAILILLACLLAILAARARALGHVTGVSFWQLLPPVLGACIGTLFTTDLLFAGLMIGQGLSIGLLAAFYMCSSAQMHDARRKPEQSRDTAALILGGQAFVVFQNLDLMALLLVAETAPFAAYLLARRIAGMVGILTDSARFVLAPNMVGQGGRTVPGHRLLGRRFRIRVSLALGLALAAGIPGLLASGLLAREGVLILTLLCLRQILPLWLGFPNVALAMRNRGAIRAKILMATILLGFPILPLTTLIGPLALAIAVVLINVLAQSALFRVVRAAPQPAKSAPTRSKDEILVRQIV